MVDATPRPTKKRQYICNDEIAVNQSRHKTETLLAKSGVLEGSLRPKRRFCLGIEASMVPRHCPRDSHYGPLHLAVLLVHPHLAMLASRHHRFVHHVVGRRQGP
jgi:hypothetical protein